MDMTARGDGIASRALHGILHGLTRLRMGFRRFRRTRPFWAGVWTMLGGAVLTYVPGTSIKFVFALGNLLWAGILVGALVLLFGLFLWLQPQFRYILGTLIILLSLFSFVTSDFGGFFIGMLLGMIGGSLAIAWVPNAPPSWRERRRARRRGELAVAGVVPGMVTGVEVTGQLAPRSAETYGGAEVTEVPSESASDRPAGPPAV